MTGVQTCALPIYAGDVITTNGLQVCRELYGGPVILSGGIGSLDDITACAEAGASGVVLGKALFEGRVDLRTAVETAAAMTDQQTF